MKDRVAIIGVGQAQFKELISETIPEMVYQAVREVLRDAQLGMADIDHVVTASVDLCDGQPASNGLVAEVVGAVMKPSESVPGWALSLSSRLYDASNGSLQHRAGSCPL